MSKKKRETCCIVIDASIAHAASQLGSKDPPGAGCRDFLLTVRNVCHRMAWSAAIRTEWDVHQSRFASQWLVSMMKLRKLRPIQDEQLPDLRSAIEASPDQNVAAIMLKDVHLVEAALASDLRVAALDEAVRGHFCRLTATVDSLRQVVWVNPAMEAEQVLRWLEKEARAEQSRYLQS